MAEAKERSKFRIESLSDMIFGLALSIGALTLIGNAPSSFTALVSSILLYAFSFLILIIVWRSYTRTMVELHLETRSALNLNILLLFLVLIEPFLFNELFSPISSQEVSTLYALDLAELYAVLALFAGFIASDKSRSEEVVRRFRTIRNTLIIAVAIFVLSIIPIFWTLTIPIGAGVSVPMRVILWIIPLLMHPIIGLLPKNG